jgi:opacity protein-like surface antigen
MSNTNELLLAGAIFLLVAGDAASAADMPMPVKAPAVALQSPRPWSWTGFYLGGHVGAALNTTDLADPFGMPLYGDQVRSPGFIAGGQIGYNYQAGPMVFGLEADVSGDVSDGTDTCFAVSGSTVSSNCRVRPDLYAALTGRLGYSFGRTLLYAKGGAAWTHGTVDMFINQNPNGVFTSSSSFTAAGWTIGGGLEYALSHAWSAKLEYDYLDFGSQNVATPYGAGNPFGAAPVTSIAEHVHQAEVGLNYRFGTDGGDWPTSSAAMATPVFATVSGWEAEAGARYIHSWGRFQKDLDSGSANGSNRPNGIVTSRLTYDDLQTDSSELFVRVDSPWNVFVKAYAGVGHTGSGHQTDEDSFVALNGTVPPYSNSISDKVDGGIDYAVADLGYDVVRKKDLKLGPFVGYMYFNELMNRYNCVQIANPKGSCEAPDEPPSPPNVVRFQELDVWQALRLGVSGEAMLTDRLKLSAEAAYIPYLTFSGLDNHFRTPIAQFPAFSNGGQGAQIEAILSYYLTDRLSVGIGGRYWTMWTTDGQFTTTPTPGPSRYYRAAFEQAGAFVQASYAFGPASAHPNAAAAAAYKIGAAQHDWNGFHVGVEVGEAWGRSKHIANSNDITPEFDVTGGLLGATIGYDAQFAGIGLFGLEGDMSWMNDRGSALNQPPFNVTSKSETKETWLSTARVRLGVTPTDRWLAYATGGIAVADVEADALPPGFSFSESHVRAGWTAGAGVEFAIDRNWSSKVEWLHVGLNDTPYFTPPPAANVANRGGGVPLREDIVRGGIDYKWN